MKLPQIAELYLSERVCSAPYGVQMRRLAGLVREPTAEAINAYLRSRLAIVSSITARNERTILLSLIKYAWERDILSKPVKGVMKVKSRKPPTRAWTVEQLQAAIAKTHDYGNRRLRSGVTLGQFLRAWLLLGYESGSRFGDIWAFSKDNIEGDTLRWVQHKTGDGITKHLSPACLREVKVMLDISPDGRVLGWTCCRRHAMRLMREHLDACGIGGTSKWLRRSGATHIEMQQPGKATLHLGHRTITLAAQAYIDWGQVRKTTPSTPELVR